MDFGWKNNLIGNNTGFGVRAVMLSQPLPLIRGHHGEDLAGLDVRAIVSEIDEGRYREQWQFSVLAFNAAGRLEVALGSSGKGHPSAAAAQSAAESYVRDIEEAAEEYERVNKLIEEKNNSSPAP